MSKRILLLLTGLSLTCSSCGKSQPETLYTGSYDEQEMDAAMELARSEVDTFIAVMQQGNGTDFSVKVPIEDANGTEYFWISNIKYRDGSFEGTIGNEPGIVKNVKFGQKWTIAKSEISDWMYLRDGKMHGNYTMRVMLKSLPEDQAEEMRSRLADP